MSYSYLPNPQQLSELHAASVQARPWWRPEMWYQYGMNPYDTGPKDAIGQFEAFYGKFGAFPGKYPSDRVTAAWWNLAGIIDRANAARDAKNKADAAAQGTPTVYQNVTPEVSAAPTPEVQAPTDAPQQQTNSSATTQGLNLLNAGTPQGDTPTFSSQILNGNKANMMPQQGNTYQQSRFLQGLTRMTGAGGRGFNPYGGGLLGRGGFFY